MKPTSNGKTEGTAASKESKSKRLTPIRKKIFIGVLFIIIVALTLLWLCQVILFDVFYFNVRINEIKATANHILLYRDKTAFYTQLASATEKNDLCATVVNGDGSIAYSAENTNTCLIHGMTLSQRETLVEKIDERRDAVFGITYDEKNNTYTLTKLSSIPFPEGTNVIYVTAFTHNGAIRYLVLDGVISPVGTVTKTTASFLITLSVLLLLVASLIAQLLSRVIATPISEIAKRAKTITTKSYTPISNDFLEIAELNEALSDASAELRQVEHLRHDLIANISHDLRTPLSLMSGYLEMMRDFPHEISEENLTTVIDECRRLTSLVNDMLDISRYENGAVAVRPERFSLTEMIEKTLISYEEFTRRDGYTVIFHRSGNIAVTADPLLITQVFTNLLNNAITYTGSDKTVTVTQSVRNGARRRVRIEVSDSGEGIEPDKLPLIWDRYYKVDAPHKRAAKGTGLGLSIVRSVITLHGGSYGVRSTPGKGSTFWFELDCHAPDAATTTALPNGTTTTSPPDRKDSD